MKLKGVLMTKVLQKTAKCIFREEILEDEWKLLAATVAEKANRVRRLLSVGKVDVDST